MTSTKPPSYHLAEPSFQHRMAATLEVESTECIRWPIEKDRYDTNVTRLAQMNSPEVDQ
ncbi:MAG: hypothetical protein AAB263_03380 [Planctomycetota bacterium]